MSIYLRHSTRHVHQTVLDYLTSHLDSLGWTDPGDVPFNSPAVAILDGFPDEWDEVSVLDPGMLVVTVGNEDSAKEEELGGLLKSIEIPFFVDCFMDTDGVALALSCDVRDILTGRFVDSSPMQQVTNYNDYPSTPAEGYQIEFEDVVRERVKNKWHVVKCSAVLLFNDVRQQEESS